MGTTFHCGVAVDKNGNKLQEIKDLEGKVSHNLVRSPQSCGRRVCGELVRKYLISVTQKGGTAQRAAILGYQVAEKQVRAKSMINSLDDIPKNPYIASFVGFAPASDPLVTVLVVVEQPELHIMVELLLHLFSKKLFNELFCLKMYYLSRERGNSEETTPKVETASR
ncbi:MAG: hypothetical protein Ct9H300mP21_07090 [Pseudomonadota bacterium]|nr:MAG: hypothetical protein Ct9H300mP21_07090 [Pseudomonadota bacterium]